MASVLARGILLAAVAAVGAAGCGGNGDEPAGETAAATPTAAATTVATTAPSPETSSLSEDDATRLAQSMLLRLEDLPTGWRADEHEETEGCAGIEKLTERYDVLAHVDSKDFVRGETTEVGSSAGLFSDEATAREAFEYVVGAIQTEEFRDCLNDALRDEEDESVTFGEVQVGEVSFPELGDQSSAWEVAIPFEAEGLSVTAYLDAVYIQRSNALAVLTFGDVFTPMDERMRERLARTVAKRMQQTETR